MEEKKTLLLEGLLPTDIWNALIVIVVLFGVFIAIYKGVVFIRDEHKKRRRERELEGQDITDRIADKVMEKLQPKLDEKFGEIDRKLAADKQAIELHTSQLNANESRVKRLADGNKALCHGVFALLSHEVNGNSIDKLKKAHDAMRDYLIDGVYVEEE